MYDLDMTEELVGYSNKVHEGALLPAREIRLLPHDCGEKQATHNWLI